MSRISIKKNIAYQMVYETLVFILPLLTSPYIARIIGPDGVGNFSYSHSVAYYFVLVSMLGVKNYGNRVIAKNRDNRENLNRSFTEVFSIHAFVSIICIAAYVFYINIVDKERQLLATIQIFYVISAFFDISWFFFGIENFKTTVTRDCIIKIVSTICVFVFVKNQNDLWKYCLIISVGSLVSQLFLWAHIRKYVAFTKVTSKGIISHLPSLIVLFIPTVAVSLYKFMDKIMIGNFSNSSQLGFYDNSEKIINIPSQLISAIGIVLMPRISNLVESDERKSHIIMESSTKYIMCLTFGMTFGLAAVANNFSVVFWGDRFKECGSLISSLCITIPFWSYASIIRTQYLIPREMDKEYLISIVSGAFINILLNSILIPIYGAFGAVIGTIGAELIVCIIQIFETRNKLKHTDYIEAFAPFILFSVVMYCAVTYLGHVLGNGLVPLILQLLVGGLVYTVECLVYFDHINDRLVKAFINRFRIRIKTLRSK